MAWVRVVWKEKNREEESVLPESWVDVDQKLVLWPNVVNAEKLLKERRKPTDGWKRFPLVKVKLRSDIYEECDSWDQTSSAETDLEALDTKRGNRKRRHDDYVYEEGAWGGSDVESGKSPLLYEGDDDTIIEDDQASTDDERIISDEDVSPGTPNPVTTRGPAPSRQSCQYTTGPTPPVAPQKLLPLHQSTPVTKRGPAPSGQSCQYITGPTPPVARQKLLPLHQSPPFDDTAHKKTPSCPLQTKDKNRVSTPAPSRQTEGRVSTARRIMSSPLKRQSGSPYPMSEARFHRKVMQMLVEIRDMLKELKVTQTQSQDTALPDKATTIEELKSLDESLSSVEERQKLIRRLAMVGGGTTMKTNVKLVMDKLMTQEVQAEFNLCGRGPIKKLAFEQLRLYSVVMESVQKSTPDSDHRIRHEIGEHLKFAPDKRKGGRKKVQDDIADD